MEKTLQLPGYVINEQIYENDRVKVSRGYTAIGLRPVVIKMLREERANPAEVSKMLYEYEIVRSLDIEGIVRPICLERSRGSISLVMEDTGAISLRKYLQLNRPGLASFFSIATKLTEALEGLHQKGIIHRDLKPDNVLIHPETGVINIIDFSTAVMFPEGSENIIPSSVSSGTFQYMSPEQTGRMNRGIDFRSDYYSLGVVFYEMLTGRLPLQADSPVEWAHAHIAIKPEPPHKINPNIFPGVSGIIMKLLSKAAEDRYQSAGGLLWDLKECERQLLDTGKIELSSPGSRDLHSSFQVPHRLYGRDKEKEALRDAYHRICNGQSDVILVSGYAGVGKTMLINDSLKPVAVEKGYFLAGKFEQIRQNKPYGPFAQAFGNLMRQLMTESQKNLDIWKQKIQSVLGRSGAVISQIIPEVELIVGPQPPVEALQPMEAQNRFFMMFRDFVKIFAGKSHPLVIFIDDLQWVDRASLQLIQYLCQDIDIPYLLLIGACRDNEITGSHPLALIYRGINRGEIPVQHIYLGPLERPQVLELISGAFNCPGERTDDLAEALHRKSGGNPFFLRQLLKLVFDEKMMYFNVEEGCWQWDIESIQKMQAVEDVVEIILRKIKKLPEETRTVLKLAACVGNAFNLKTLSIVCQMTEDETLSHLLPAIMEGLVLPAGENNKALPVPSAGLNEFLHDRVQQAAYSLIPEEEKQEVHLKVGRLLLHNTGKEEPGEEILYIMDHFNRSLSLIEDIPERIKIAGYNLLAGQKARSSAAYDSALNYLKSGIKLLPDNRWDSLYKLSYDLYLECAQCEYLSGNAGEAETLFDALIEHAKSEIERAGIYGLKMVLCAGTAKYAEAAQIGIDALGKFGIKIPSHPTKFDYLKELILYKWQMRNKSIESLKDLPEIEDPVQRKVAELLIRLACVTSSNRPDLYGLTIIKVANHAARHGNTEFSSVGYLGYSITSGNVLGDYETGRELGEVSISLVEKYNKSFSKCIVYYVYGAIVSHWTQNGKTGLEYLKKAEKYAIEAGDVLIAGYSYATTMKNKYIMGASLGEILEEIKKCQGNARRLKHESLAIAAETYRELVTALMDYDAWQKFFSGTDVVDDGYPESSIGDKASPFAWYLSRMQLFYFSGDYPKALSMAERVGKYAGSMKGFMILAEYVFYLSLVITALYDELAPKERKRYWRVLQKNEMQMRKWSHSCSENFEHKYLLILAERARILNKVQEAMSLYDRAIKSAQGQGYIQNEALANELAAKFYMKLGREKIAGIYMNDACISYNRWGAKAKARSLQDKYSCLVSTAVVKDYEYNSAGILEKILISSADSGSEAAVSLDMCTIRKAVQNISEETDSNKLLTGFLDIAMENSGADKGYLVLEKGGRMYIEAARDSNKEHADVIEPVPVEKCTSLSRAIVFYAARTLETVVIDGKEKAGIFVRDPYISQSSKRSIVCLPVLFQKIPVGVLYLENNLTAGVFTQERVEVLKLLSTQMAYVKKLQSYLQDNTERVREEACTLLIDPLTDRETDVLKLIAAGMSNKEIGEKLDMALNTVKTHVKNIYGKLQVSRRVQVVTRARELNLIPETPVMACDS